MIIYGNILSYTEIKQAIVQQDVTTTVLCSYNLFNTLNHLLVFLCPFLLLSFFEVMSMGRYKVSTLKSKIDRIGAH